MSKFLPLLLTAAGGQAADQLALAALPLTAILVLQLDGAGVGYLVAAQGLAWAAVSLPGGILVDRWPRRFVLMLASALSAIALALAYGAVQIGGVWLLGIAVFIAAAGTVLLGLGVYAAVPSLIETSRLPSANARIELARAVSALGAPALVGLLAAQGRPQLGLALGCGFALLGLVAGSLTKTSSRPPQVLERPPLVRMIWEGVQFVLDQPLLRAIGLCAIFWNFAFFVLIAAFVPFALEVIHLEAAQIGLVQAALGAGNIAGAALAGPILTRLPPNLVLLGGPALSVLAALLILGLPYLPASFTANGGIAVAAYGLLGFGPMLWLVCQTSLRQLVTPPALMGRVSAAIQMTIYGVRPLGALSGGLIVSAYGGTAAMALVALGFFASLLVAAGSGLRRLIIMPQAVTAIT